MKKLLIKLFITPERVRKAIAMCISWFMTWVTYRECWHVVRELPAWLRRAADIIDAWDDTELSPERDRLVADLVGRAITNEQLDGVVEKISQLSVEEARDAG